MKSLRLTATNGTKALSREDGLCSDRRRSPTVGHCHRTDVTGTEPAASVPATAVQLPSGQANIAANAG